MRIRKILVALCAAAVGTCSVVAIGGATITGSSGKVTKLASAPASVKLNALENATNAVAFDERQNATLGAAVAVDAVNPGTYSSFPSGSAKVAAGTVVDSHLIHSDIPSRNYTARRQGTVTFAAPIVGVVASTAKLASSDAALGASGTQYAGTTQWRGLESGESSWLGGDKFTISPDRLTLTFDIQTYVMDELRVLTNTSIQLTTSIADAPDPVTVGNDVQYTLTVTNTGATAVANAHVVDTLPAGTTLVSASASGGCTGSGPVDCTLGPLATGASAQAVLLVTSPTSVPEGGTITNSAVATPGTNTPATQATTVAPPSDGAASGYVSPGGSITTSGNDPATLSLPNTGNGAPVVITQGDGSFCDGPCDGTTTTINDFAGYPDPLFPIHLELAFTFPDSPTSLFQAATAFGQSIYKNDDPLNPNVGTVVPSCTTPGAGVAIPHPCLDAKNITQPTPNTFVVTFEIVYVSGDPKFGRR
jgi:uncharacterized repeat protein (TIGR01451 family)